MLALKLTATVTLLSGLAAAIPWQAASLSLSPRQDDTSNCTEYVSPSTGYRTICRPSDCSETYTVQANDTCAGVAAKLGTVSASILHYFNRELSVRCALQEYMPYCIDTPWYTFEGETQYPYSSIVELATVAPTAYPVPWDFGVVENCNRLYLAGPGQTAYGMSQDAGVTLSQVFEWNQYIEADGSGFWAEYWYCVGVSS